MGPLFDDVAPIATRCSSASVRHLLLGGEPESAPSWGAGRQTTRKFLCIKQLDHTVKDSSNRSAMKTAHHSGLPKKWPTIPRRSEVLECSLSCDLKCPTFKVETCIQGVIKHLVSPKTWNSEPMKE